MATIARTNANGGSEDLSITVDGVAAAVGPHEATAVELGIEGYQLSPYEAARRSVNAHEPIRPGIEFAGRTVTELSDGFDPKPARIEIVGVSDSSDRDQLEATVWHYDDTHLAIDEAATRDDRTIAS